MFHVEHFVVVIKLNQFVPRETLQCEKFWLEI
jgi:hypothetical protein